MSCNKVLVAGGAGFIGSHTIVELVAAGYSVFSGDSYYNSDSKVYEAIGKITGVDVKYCEIDFCNEEAVFDLFLKHRFDVVIHFAGYKSVGESFLKPIEYYSNNIMSAITLGKASIKYGTKHFIFSSSATVYGNPQFLPLTESHPTTIATNPYGNTKFFIEQILRDVHKAHPELQITLLRYFNPVGAHKSGLIGEQPQGIPNNLMPYICQVANGIRRKLSIFGNDYDTVDGTGVRDFIHVVDLAKGHIAAMKANSAGKGVSVYNLGTGQGTSVLELVETFKTINKVSVPYVFAPRRPGDVAACWADPSLAEKELGWTAKCGLNEMVRDSWEYQKGSQL